MLAIFNCASAASGILGKKVSKSRYSCSACASDAVPPSAYQESPTASLARAMNSESGYVLISVCSVIRATSKRLCFIASIDRSNKTLSGCLDPIFASGLTDFLLVQATVNSSRVAVHVIVETRRSIEYLEDLEILMWGQPPSAVRPGEARLVVAPASPPAVAVASGRRTQTFCSAASVAALNKSCAFFFGSPLPNTALPATRISAPARTTSATVSSDT